MEKKEQLVSSEYGDISCNLHTLHILITPAKYISNWLILSLFTAHNIHSNTTQDVKFY